MMKTPNSVQFAFIPGNLAVRRSLLALICLFTAQARGAAFTDANWMSMGGPPSGDVNAVAVDGSGNVYIGGAFTLVGDVAANHIAKWNGSSWSALGSGLNGTDARVYSLAVSGSDLYVGGGFTNAGGNPATNIARWNGSSWSALGSGVGGTYRYVYALAVSGTDLYAGGQFTNAGGVSANNIAKWNGSSWSALGSGMNWQVYALAVLGSDVYAGGAFTAAAGSPAYRIAKWNGSSWSALGAWGIGTGDIYDEYVNALAASGTDVYVGGHFGRAGGSSASDIAKWNGSSWSALGSGLGDVYALAVSGSDVYAGGSFTGAGDSPATNIAKWDGSSWLALGSGIGGRVNALAVSGSDLYAGGSFTTAGGKVSPYIAHAYLLPLPILSVLHSGSEVVVSWPSTDTADFMLEQVSALALPASWVSNTASVADDGTNKSVTLPAPSGAQFFRLRRP